MFYWLVVFGKCFSFAKFKAHSHDIFFSRTFDLLLINSSKYLLFGVYFSLHQKNTVCKYKLQRRPIIKLKTDMHFHLSLILMLKNPVLKPCFLSCRVKISYQQLLIQSRYAVVWNARFHHQDHLDFVKHLINVYLLKEVYINS